MIRCKIVGKNNNKWFEVADGAVFIENYNETLDSGTILIQQLSQEIDIEPYDIVEIESFDSGISIKSRRMCVDTYQCTQTSLNPLIFSYQISLFSETKQLEGILLPSLTITKLFNTTRSVYDYIWRYVQLYAPNTNYEPSSISPETKAWSLGHNINNVNDTIVSRFGAIDCPEFQWNQPTLREVLNDLMMVDDCIPVVQNNVINFLCISEIGTEITDEQKQGINYISKSQSSEDYVSELKMNLVNGANNSVPVNGIIPQNATQIVEKIGFRNNDSYLLTTENILLQTSFPIWKIFSCVFYCSIYTRIRYRNINTQEVTETNQWLDVAYPITSYILEHKEWLSKDVFYGDWGNQTQLSTNYRNTCLYYVRGQKDIRNFNDFYTSQFLFIKSDVSVYRMILDKIENDTQGLWRSAQQWVDDNLPPYYEVILVEMNSDPKYYNVTFELSYEPISESVFRASKSPMPTHIRQVVDNQTNSYVDIERQGMLEYFKANRLGNKMLTINGRYYTNESNIPDLAETINDNIIFQKQISIYNNHIDTNYYATENYVLRDYFTGVKAKLRSWRVVSGDEALIRADLVKFYVNDNISDVVNDIRVVPSRNIDWYMENFKYCGIRFITSQGIIKPESTEYGHTGTIYPVNGIAVEFMKQKMGNSIVFTIKMPDNYYASNYVSDYHGTGGELIPVDQIEQKGIGYTDDDGEVISCEICFYTQFIQDIFSDLEANRGLKPLILMTTTRFETLITGNLNYSDMIFKFPLTIYKDQKEIPQISIQFEFNEEANDMFLGRK